MRLYLEFPPTRITVEGEVGEDIGKCLMGAWHTVKVVMVRVLFFSSEALNLAQILSLLNSGSAKASLPLLSWVLLPFLIVVVHI